MVMTFIQEGQNSEGQQVLCQWHSHPSLVCGAPSHLQDPSLQVLLFWCLSVTLTKAESSMFTFQPHEGLSTFHPGQVGHTGSGEEGHPSKAGLSALVSRELRLSNSVGGRAVTPEREEGGPEDGTVCSYIHPASGTKHRTPRSTLGRSFEERTPLMGPLAADFHILVCCLQSSGARRIAVVFQEPPRASPQSPLSAADPQASVAHASARKAWAAFVSCFCYLIALWLPLGVANLLNLSFLLEHLGCS